MGNEVTTLKTSQGLLDALRQASNTQRSAAEICEQRISFVYGSIDVDSGVTRAQVKEVLLRQVGGR